MKKRVLVGLMGMLLFAAPAFAQQRLIRGTVTDDNGAPLANVQVMVVGTSRITATSAEGGYTINASTGQTLQFRFIGRTPVAKVVGTSDVIDVQLRRTAVNLDAIVVTALGQNMTERSVGTAQQTVQGVDIAQTQRTNFVNSLQGRVAGVQVATTSGVPGASSEITIRGISSISSSNQPLMIVDGLPLDNKVMNSNTLASGRAGSANSFENRAVDFTNRAADLNPEDIESLVVLKGPAASALYGIDAANGAIVITTKKGRAGVGGMDYSTAMTVQTTSGAPEIQQMFDTSACSGCSGYNYFGAPYAPGTKFYNNADNFFRTGLSSRNNFAFTGGSQDSKLTYRVSASSDRDLGVIPNTKYNRYNITGRSSAQVTSWLNADLSMIYANTVNNQPYKGNGSPLLGLLVWPQTDNAADWLTPAGTRRMITGASATAEYDNPYFSVNKNKIDSKNNRIVSNLGLTLTPFSWASVKSNIGIDGYTNENNILRHPESWQGAAYNGVLDVGDDVTRNLTQQTLLNFNSYALTDALSITGFIGTASSDYKSSTVATTGQDFLDPNFVSINNTNLRYSLTTIGQRRVVSGLGSATLDFKHYLYLTATGRNDWTSTIPKERNSFFYPSFNTSFVFSDAFPSVAKYVSGKLTAAYAEVGRDARPYAYSPALEYKTTSFGGYGFGFWGPNRNLKPEFAKDWELGTELSFLNDRLGLATTYWSKRTFDQIVNNIRGSYATGFILFNLNGASTKNAGLELTMNAIPVLKSNFEWDILANFDKAKGKTLQLPNELPESYNSDSWVYGNVRNGVQPGTSTQSLTGRFWLRNKDGKLLISPTTGLPIQATDFVDAGYDRAPDYTLGVTNSFRYKAVSLNFLLDFRRGGDILNATEHYLTVKGLSKETEDRWTPRVIDGVLRDGKENSGNPTPNNIVIVPATNTDYYTDISEEMFIENDINWLRLRDITLNYTLPKRILPNASIFVTGTDLFMLTNYSGLDPLSSASNPATGGSGSVGIDYGSFATPRAISFGAKVRF
jgi:TonB-linked SusC/RagA family outer membrane protein